MRRTHGPSGVRKVERPALPSVRCYAPLGGGVAGNTPAFGAGIQGSIPCPPATRNALRRLRSAPSSRGGRESSYSAAVPHRRSEMALLSRRLVAAFGHTNELAASLDEPGLRDRNGSARSNTIGGQLWCVVGARESYARALEAGTWAGFSCSLDEPHSPDAVRASLAGSQRVLLEAVEGRDHLTEAQENLLFEVLEHEVQHHGQLIRYFYANGVSFPPAFARRYALG